MQFELHRTKGNCNFWTIINFTIADIVKKIQVVKISVRILCQNYILNNCS